MTDPALARRSALARSRGMAVRPFTIGVLAIASAACGNGPERSAETSPGQALYEANCAACHGPQAMGDGPLAASLPIPPPSLMEHLGHHPQAQLVQLIRSGVPPAMPPAPLSDEEVLLVIDYAWTLVPDSMVAGLREMQRMAEMGVEMDMDGMEMDDMDMDHSTGDSTGVMDHSGSDSTDAMDHSMEPDTTGR